MIKEKTIENIIIKDDPSINIKSSEEKKEEFVESEPMEEEAYSSLKQLTTFSRDFIIFIRVTKKSDIKIFETRYNHHYNYNPSYINPLSNLSQIYYYIYKRIIIVIKENCFILMLWIKMGMKCNALVLIKP